jgi:tRNA G18 (ribose-2'-O)-methylase SpoU
MPAQRVDDIRDPRLDAYRHLRLRNLTRHSQRFIAESGPLVQRLLQSDYSVESILVDEKHWPDARKWIPDAIDAWIVPHDQIDALLGFDFHRGILACGLRKADQPSRALLQRIASERPHVGVWAIGMQDPENLGVLMRTCAALGIRSLFVGPQTADPLSRRALRVSMGNALKLQFHHVPPCEVQDLLRQAGQHAIATLAASLQQPSCPLTSLTTQRPTLVLLGNEAQGIPADIQSRVDARVQIPMELATDSLNVSVAAGIILHHLTRIAQG